MAVSSIKYLLDFEEHLSPIMKRGKVVLTEPLPDGSRIEVIRKTPIINPFEDEPMEALKPFPTEAFENALDRICYIQQEIEGHLCDCRGPEFPGTPGTEDPDPPGNDTPECQPYECDALTTAISALNPLYLFSLGETANPLVNDGSIGATGNASAAGSTIQLDMGISPPWSGTGPEFCNPKGIFYRNGGGWGAPDNLPEADEHFSFTIGSVFYPQSTQDGSLLSYANSIQYLPGMGTQGVSYYLEYRGDASGAPAGTWQVRSRGDMSGMLSSWVDVDFSVDAPVLVAMSTTVTNNGMSGWDITNIISVNGVQIHEHNGSLTSFSDWQPYPGNGFSGGEYARFQAIAFLLDYALSGEQLDSLRVAWERSYSGYELPDTCVFTEDEI